MLVNDDLAAFIDFAAMIDRRVADFENATASRCVEHRQWRRADAGDRQRADIRDLLRA